MRHGASVGWLAVVSAIGAICVVACGGMSENTGGSGDGSSDDAPGGSSGSGSGGASSGGTSVGGSTPAGGAAQGGSTAGGGASSGVGGAVAVGGAGTGAGGTIAVGGAGAGGSSSCPDCPDRPEGEYGLVIEDDGRTLEMIYNGWIDAAADRIGPACAETPLRGTVGGCSRTIAFSACADPMSGPPCLEVSGMAVRYISLRTGELFEGMLTSDVPTSAFPGVTSGDFTADLTNAAGESLTLRVSYAFCAPFGTLRIVC